MKKTLRIQFNDKFPSIDSHLEIDDEDGDGDGIFNIEIKAVNNIFLNFKGIDNILFKMFRSVDEKLMFQFNDNTPIDSGYLLEQGMLVLRFDTKIPGENFTFIDGENKVKIYAE